MPPRQCSATDQAILLHKSGLSIRAAAKAAGVAPSTLVRALKRQPAAPALRQPA
jgi:lambda repressor-like predicted transcriptional regulator